ncbi:MAG: FAD:protein FMN transferase [Treponema sp.]|jgi:thiamine biosynthesis lipoprotein|nr:FAD:protein FMN transferase [Treponema sp.]
MLKHKQLHSSISGKLCLCLLSLILVSCKKPPASPPRTIFALGTVCSLNVYDEGTDELYGKLITRLNDIERMFDVHSPESEVSHINQNAGIEPVQVSPEVLAVLDTACYFAEKTGGAFDPSIGPLAALWGIASDNPRIPSQAGIDDCLLLVDYRKIVYDKDANTVFLPEKGMSLDLGGIAKGFAADELVKILEKAKVRQAIIDLGGNIYVYGQKPGNEKWRVGVKDPENPDDSPVVRLEIGSSTVVTSGMYERFFEQDGVRYHHILDPKTGYPANSGLLSVTIVSPSSLAADALSTSAFVLGKDKALALFAQGFQDAGFSADMLLIEETHVVTATQNLKSATVILLSEYQFAGE